MLGPTPCASDQSTSDHEEVNSAFIDMLHGVPFFRHQKCRSLVRSYLYMLILASDTRDAGACVVLAAGASWIFHPVPELIPSLLCSCNAALLMITAIFQRGFAYPVHNIGLLVYCSSGQKFKQDVRLPFAIIAYGTTAMLLVVVWGEYISVLSVSSLLRIILLVEAICVASLVITSPGYMHQYKPLISQLGVLRYLDGATLSDEETTSLQSQHENLRILSREISHLLKYTSKSKRPNDGSTPPVDLRVFCVADNEELQTLTAIANQLLPELQFAYSLIAEKEEDIQRVCNNNYQYMQENERLRATLREWSAMAAKLERALEIERMSNLELEKKIRFLQRSLT